MSVLVRKLLMIAPLLLGIAFAATAQDTIKIAYLAPLSGTFALTFEENLRVFRAATDVVNARGGTEQLVEAKSSVPPIRCQMERPPR